jgi:hypothetical protein
VICFIITIRTLDVTPHVTSVMTPLNFSPGLDSATRVSFDHGAGKNYDTLEKTPGRLSYKPYFFSQRTVFFSHNKSATDTFSYDFSTKPNEQVLKLNLHRVAQLDLHLQACSSRRSSACLFVDQLQANAVSRGGTWAVPCQHGMKHGTPLSCFVPLRSSPLGTRGTSGRADIAR